MVSLPVKTAALRGLFLSGVLALLAGCSSMPTSFRSLISGDASGDAASALPAAASPMAAIEQAWTNAADECGKQVGAPQANACGALAQRGRTLQCLASQFTRSGAALGYSAPEGLDTWGRCVDDIGQTLVGGFYLRHAEIERRMLLCHANLAAAPDARKPEVLTRLRKFISFTSAAEEEKRVHPVGVVPAMRSAPADLQKCSVVMALTEPMQAAPPVVRAPVTPQASAAVAQPLPTTPPAKVSQIEPASETPAPAKKPAPAAKKPVSVKKPAAKDKAS